MKTSRLSLLVALFLVMPGMAWSNPVHNVWANVPIVIGDSGSWYNATSTNCAFSWNEGTGQAFANAQATITVNNVNYLYEFQLVSVTGTTASSQINGLWNVKRNGVLLCGNCAGSAYGLGPVGSSFKIYVQNSTYHLSGTVSSRYDF